MFRAGNYTTSGDTTSGVGHGPDPHNLERRHYERTRQQDPKTSPHGNTPSLDTPSPMDSCASDNHGLYTSSNYERTCPGEEQYDDRPATFAPDAGERGEGWTRSAFSTRRRRCSLRSCHWNQTGCSIQDLPIRLYGGVEVGSVSPSSTATYQTRFAGKVGAYAPTRDLPGEHLRVRRRHGLLGADRAVPAWGFGPGNIGLGTEVD